MFYNRLEALCLSIKTTPTAFVEGVLSMSRSNVTKWKDGVPPKSDTIMRIAEYFNVSTDYLLGKTDIKNNPTAEYSDEVAEMLKARPLLRELAEKLSTLDDDQLAAFLKIAGLSGDQSQK